MTEDTTTDRREQIRREIDALTRELEALPPAATVTTVLEQNRERADAANALRPKRGSP